MKRFPKILRVLLPIVIVVTVLAVLINVWLVDFLVKMSWYDSLGYLQLLFLKIGYKYIVLGGVTFFFFLLIFFNFLAASRFLGVTKFHKETKVRKMIQGFRSGSMKIYTPVALLLGVLLAMPLFREWENFLLFFNAPQTGDADALFGLDVSIYLFALPVMELLHSRILMTLILMLICLGVLYAAELKVLSKEDQPLYRGAKFHLSFVVFLIFLVHAGGYGLEALMMQFSTNNIDRFYGPGFTEIYCQLPLIGIAAFMALPLALSVISWIYRQKGLKTVILFTILALCAHLFRNNQMLFDSVNAAFVTPNEFEKQEKFIDQSIQSTLTAYQLKKVELRHYEMEELTAPFNITGGANQLENIPLWDNELLEEVYHQFQAITPYYSFTGVDAARYMIEGDLHQVYLAPREIDVKRLATKAKSWVNLHLKYTHGYGLVMSPAAQEGEERMEWYIHNMPPESDVGFVVNEPSIYYGLEDLEYVIAPNDSGEFHYPGNDDDASATNNYTGKGGIPISNLWKKTLFALYFKDRNIFFTQQTTADSKIHFRRNIIDRIKELTPFFQLDENPYLVVTPDRLYWFVDAYTTSKWYPNSQPFNKELNYIRNSIKIVVDAYDGTVTYYLADASDPIARAYQKMYPGLILDLKEMPVELQSQIRYPKNLFEIQMQIYAVYHQDDAKTFYQSEDRLRLVEFDHQDTVIQMRPYYITLDLVEPGKREFLMMTPLLPYDPDEKSLVEDDVQLENVKAPRRRDRQLDVLRALAVARSDIENYGQIIFYTFPKGSQIPGPPQINALIDQNTEIAQSITLWNQQGSSVKRGKMVILPVDGRIVYIQPFYMQSSSGQSIPQLKRVIVSVDQEVAMDFSIEKAMQKIYKKLKKDDSPLFQNLDVGLSEPTVEPTVEAAPEINTAE